MRLSGSVHYFYCDFSKKHSRVHTISFGSRLGTEDASNVPVYRDVAQFGGALDLGFLVPYGRNVVFKQGKNGGG